MVGREARPSDLEVDIRNDSFWFVRIAADAGAKGLWTRARCIRNTRGLRFNRSGKNDPRNTRTGTRICSRSWPEGFSVLGVKSSATRTIRFRDPKKPAYLQIPKT